MGGGVDDLAGYAVHSTILQVPEADVTRNRKPVADPTRTERRGRRLVDDRAAERSR